MRLISLRDETLHRVLAVARELSASANLRQILSVIIDAMRDVLHAERATVFEYDSSSDELFSTVAHGFEEGGAATDESSAEIRFPSHQGLAGESAQERRLINVPDASTEPRFNPEIDKKTGFNTRSLLSIPLVGYDNELIGVAQVLNKSTGSFSSDDENIAIALAAQAAVAIKRGRLIEDQMIRQKLERDLQVAKHIQQSTFPSTLPELTGFEIEAWNSPAEQTGGDAFDVIACASDSVEVDRAVLLMADAMGHGIGPALSVTQVRSMLRMAVMMNGDLERIAVHINRQLCNDLPDGRFVTAWLGELDASTHTLTSFSAGQAPLMRYVAAADRFEILNSDTMPFGVMDDITITVENRFKMNHGDVFAVISDGVFEATNAEGEQFGVERTKSALRSARDGPAAKIAETICNALDAHTRGLPAMDDRTMIIIKRKDA